MPELVECSVCERRFVADAAKKIEGRIACPKCVDALREQIKLEERARARQKEQDRRATEEVRQRALARADSLSETARSRKDAPVVSPAQDQREAISKEEHQGFAFTLGRLVAKMPSWCRALCWVALLLAWAFTLWKSFGPLVLLNYLLLAVLVLVTVWAFRRKLPTPRYFRPVAIGACILALSLHAWLDRRTRRYYKGGDLHIATYGRFTSRWNYWEIYPASDDSFLYSMKGPISDSGKRHGKWCWFWKPQKGIPYRDPITYTWHWYGEKITEGEWHLRNK